ncbi:hypothetical protein BGX34_005724 [Mortierella sp. NVP85]|nr:hypothetical protein BGX34_005724 [Mortierella sp. NVP85]
MDGLQGLKDIKVISIAGLDFPGSGDTVATSVIRIHNPSKLTLKLGKMILKAGRNTTESGYTGKSTIDDLVLVPGDNELGSILWMEAGGPATTEITLALSTSDVKLALYGFDGSSPNPALAAGLKSLVTSVVLPLYLITPPAAPAYDKEASIKILPTTKDDGLVDITFKLNNPPKVGLTVYEFFDKSGAWPTTMDIETNRYKLIPQPFTTPFHLNAGESNTITRQFKLQLSAETGPLVEKGRAGSVRLGVHFWAPTLRIDGMSKDYVPDWSAPTVHGMGNYITLKTGPDFELLLDYKYPTAPVNPVTPATPTTETPAPQPPVTETPAPQPPVTEPPVTEPPTTPEPETPVTSPEPSPISVAPGA